MTQYRYSQMLAAKGSSLAYWLFAIITIRAAIKLARSV
jgi:hypothetical protein